MLVLAVAGVHDVRVGDRGDELRRADLRVADHDHVRVVGRERERGVLQRLALLDRGAARLHRHRVGREPLGGQLERRRGARRGLEEHVHDEPAAQRRQLLRVALLREREGVRGREQPLDVAAVEVADREQVAAARSRVGGSSSPGTTLQRTVAHASPSSDSETRTTRSTSSTSSSCTWTRSPRAVGRFLPT